MELIVCKFGGSSVATPEKLKRIEEIIQRNPSRRCIVLSAPGKAPGIPVKVTDLLIRVVRKRLREEDVAEEINEVKRRYRSLFGSLVMAGQSIDDVLEILDGRVESTRDDPRKYRDKVIAAGEELCARLFARFLNRNETTAEYVGPGDAGLLVTEEFGDAQPLEETSNRLAGLRKICEEKVVVFPGFFGLTAGGEIATFSRGGSDLTGAILAEALDAAEYENWTDVDGIFRTSPHLVDHPGQIPALTYREMRELSYIGFNVFHDEAVKPTMRKKIPIRLRNTNNLDNAGTLIVSKRLPGERDVVGIAGGGDYCNFSLEKFLMNREKGFGRRLLGIFEELGLSYEHCPSGVDNISVILDQKQLSPEIINATVRAIEERLKPDALRTEFGIALVSVVGEGLVHKVGVLAQAASALARAGVNIKMANQGSSEISMIFGIDAADEKRAVQALYEEFFG